VGRSWLSFFVRIDGRRAGNIKRGLSVGEPTEFTVEPGTHTVAISTTWGWSRPLQVVVKRGSRAELVIRGRLGKMGWWMDILPMAVALVIAEAFVDILLGAMGFANANWWARTGLVAAVYLVLLAGFILVTSLFSDYYPAMWTLEPAGTSSPPEPVGG
jgi:hypothetical protein